LGGGLLWAVFLKIMKVTQIFDQLFFSSTICVLTLTKLGWATFWANFSQTRLVTLLITDEKHQGKSLKTVALVVSSPPAELRMGREIKSRRGIGCYYYRKGEKVLK
jgi:hypothetical protein